MAALHNQSERADVELARSPEPPSSSPPPKRSLIMGILFVIFCFVRAAHPAVITASKTRLPDGSVGYAYEKIGPVILKNLVVCLCTQLVTIVAYGGNAWYDIWTLRPLLIFGVNGVLFAFDDFFEMASLGKMHGAAYQILNQSKILITAFLLIPFKGVYQTRVQWTLLSMLVIAMSLYMCIGASGKGSGNEIPFVAYLFTLMKVTFSCLAAVYTDKFAKLYSKQVPLPVQLTQTYFVRTIVATALTGLTPQIWSNGFFQGWDALTIAVTVSFGIKSSMGFTVLAMLDAILKNLAECVGVLLIFSYDVLAPWVDFEFDMAQFLAVTVIVLSIVAYVDSKEMVTKAYKYDQTEKEVENTSVT